MLSESARAASAAEARFRVAYPNSVARRIKVIALDPPAERVVRRLAGGAGLSASFLTTVKDQSHTASDWLSDLAGEALDLLDQVSGADAVVTISTAGENAEDVAIIGEVCHARRIMLTALVIDSSALPDAQLLRTMAPLRVHAAMLVVAKGEEYVEAMLSALRA